ncbi:MAG: hypothetical protein ACOC16_01550 [Nanoarchaeota archaeon]
MKNKKIAIIPILIILLSFNTYALTIEKYTQPTYVGENFFINNCDSNNNNYTIFYYCQYYCTYCKPYNYNGACNILGECC